MNCRICALVKPHSYENECTVTAITIIRRIVAAMRKNAATNFNDHVFIFLELRVNLNKHSCACLEFSTLLKMGFFDR